MTSSVIELDEPRVSLCGSSAVMFDAEGPMTLQAQERIWSLGKTAGEWHDVVDVQTGMNSLLVAFDNRLSDPECLSRRLLEAWSTAKPGAVNGKVLEVGVVYGGDRGEDLADVAAYHRVDCEAVVQLHAAPEYIVFAPPVGVGFGYLFGLDPRLFTPRRNVPVIRRVGGWVIIGGAQAILGKPLLPGTPPTAPTGWHVLGHAPDAPNPFDVSKSPPNLLNLGDRIRFRIERIER